MFRLEVSLAFWREFQLPGKMSDGWPEECFHPLTLVDFLYSVIEEERTLSFLGLQFDWESVRNCGFNSGI